MIHGAHTILAGALIILCAGIASASDSVSQTVGHGQIDWSKKTITATGSGAPNLKAPNVAVARLGAERAAKMVTAISNRNPSLRILI